MGQSPAFVILYFSMAALGNELQTAARPGIEQLKSLSGPYGDAVESI